VTEDTPWLATDELEAWASLASLLVALPQAIDRQLKRDSGLNFFEYSILSGLSREPGRAMQLSVLAALSAGSLSRISHAVSRLEQQGWVRRRACDTETRDSPTEARGVHAVLTDAGMAKLVEAAPAHVREARRLVVDALDPAELTQLKDICAKLVATASPATACLLARALSSNAEA
jgi:DNA-binding MarR family transcriptional regulator